MPLTGRYSSYGHIAFPSRARLEARILHAADAGREKPFPDLTIWHRRRPPGAVGQCPPKVPRSTQRARLLAARGRSPVRVPFMLLIPPKPTTPTSLPAKPGSWISPTVTMLGTTVITSKVQVMRRTCDSHPAGPGGCQTGLHLRSVSEFKAREPAGLRLLCQTVPSDSAASSLCPLPVALWHPAFKYDDTSESEAA